MEKFEIVGGRELNGSVTIAGSKNAALPILAACLLCKQKVVLKNVPRINDVFSMIKILNCMGVKTRFGRASLSVDASEAHYNDIPPHLAQKIRSSIFLLGSFLSRFGHAVFCYPGGCNIGARPIDLHIKGLRELGVEIQENFGKIVCDAKNMRSADVTLAFPSVGATENLILASVLCPGKTRIKNAAREPEIKDLADFINTLGGNVQGAGSETIEIFGVEELRGGEFSVMPDRIITGTFLLGAAICGGRVELLNARADHVEELIKILRQKRCFILSDNDKIYVSSHGRLKTQDIKTAPYPLFPTDLQNQYLVLAAVSSGKTIVEENLFETRFKVADELAKMGAKICVKDRCAKVVGVRKLMGATVQAKDLRGGASLVLAGLAANGTTIVNDVEHIDRGYYKFEKELEKLGANIRRIES